MYLFFPIIRTGSNIPYPSHVDSETADRTYKIYYILEHSDKTDAVRPKQYRSDLITDKTDKNIYHLYAAKDACRLDNLLI